nr:unnamed protein product [Callosobruchus analis]
MKIIQKSRIWLRFPINNIAEAQQEWSSKHQFPCTFGAVDCTHIGISVQATCNAKGEFASIVAQPPVK